MARKHHAVHPVAALFPMMNESELNDLAADIKANGLIHPIVLGEWPGQDGATVEGLVDGRNRERACELAGVEPSYQKLNGHDTTAYILSENIARRHMTKGAIAMVCALAFPEPEERGRGKKSVAATHFPMVSSDKLAHARTVLKFAPDLINGVIAGVSSLDAAYEIARQRRADAATAEQKLAALRAEAPDLADAVADQQSNIEDAINKLTQRRADEAKLALIETDAPDLVALVHEGRMSVMDAMAAHEKRQEIDRNERQGATSLLSQIVQLINVGASDPKDVAKRLMAKVDKDLWPADALGELTEQQLEACGQMLRACAQALKSRKKRK